MAYKLLSVKARSFQIIWLKRNSVKGKKLSNMWPICYSVLGQDSSTHMWPKGNLMLLHRWPNRHSAFERIL